MLWPGPACPRKDGDPHAGGRLDAIDAAELTEMAQFLTGWLTRDPARLAASLEEFTGHPAFGLDELRGDPERFTFLLGGGDSEQLSGP
jgi:hypothetical protein